MRYILLTLVFKLLELTAVDLILLILFTGKYWTQNSTNVLRPFGPILSNSANNNS